MIEKENLLSAIREGEICRNGDFVASRLIRKMEIFGFLPYCSTVATSAVFSSLFSGLSISDYLIAADRIACKVVKKISISGTEYEYRTFPIFKKIQINRTSKKILLEDLYIHYLEIESDAYKAIRNRSFNECNREKIFEKLCKYSPITREGDKLYYEARPDYFFMYRQVSTPQSEISSVTSHFLVICRFINNVTGELSYCIYPPEELFCLSD
jgi:hypothetical protein